MWTLRPVGAHGAEGRTSSVETQTKVNTCVEPLRFITCSVLHGFAKRTVADAVGGYHREIVHAAAVQALDGARGGGAVAVKSISVHRAGRAIVRYSTFTGIPGQEGRVVLTFYVHSEAVRGAGT